MSSSIDIRPAREIETRTALRLSLATHRQSAGDLERQVSAYIEYARALSLDAHRHWFALRDGRFVAAVSFLGSPGRTGLIFVSGADRFAVEADAIGTLMDRITGELAAAEVRLLQCLTRPADDWNRDVLLSAGFTQLAILRYMECPVGPSDTPALSPEHEEPQHGDVDWVTYAPATHREFADTIVASYEGSLDCRGLAGLRDIEDIIAGHKASGRFNPEHWRLLRVGGAPAGCCLLVQNPLRRALEVAYLGVIPAFRGRGVGRRLVDSALALAQRQQMVAVSLAVDSANFPAIGLYETTGFRLMHARHAHIRLLDSSRDGT